MQNLIQKLIKKTDNKEFISEVFDFAKKAYENVVWISGENYIDHAVRVALILYDMGIDQQTIIASLLSNALNDKEPSYDKKRFSEIEKKFGGDIASLAQKASDLNKIYYSIAIDVKAKKTSTETKVENIKKMFFAIAKDVRAIIIKLAARIDGMNNLKKMPKAMQNVYATETLQIFAPIANRLGLGHIKTQLEDMAFEHLYPEEFSWLYKNIKEKYEERQRYIKKFIPHLKRTLHKEHIQFTEIGYRAKSYWSTYEKLKARDMDFEKIYDLVALRVVVKDVQACYRLLGIIHKNFPPLSGQIQDYIAKPKANGYQSIHTTVLIDKEHICEIQIKTEQMHHEAQYGICAHWSYKERIDPKKEKFLWTKEIPQFLKTFNISFFENEIFAFTPKGDVISLPKGSTPVDFAYAVHSDVGNHCQAAKIDGKIVPLSQGLNNGDVVEIITSPKRKPSPRWLGFVKTSFAKSHIKKIITLALSPILFVPNIIKKKVFSDEKAKKPVKPRKAPQPQLYIGGQKGIAFTIAKCCIPQKSDIIKAYLAKSGPAVLHKVSCKNFQEISQKMPHKIVDAFWQND